jgi:hypothetical protein
MRLHVVPAAIASLSLALVASAAYADTSDSQKTLESTSSQSAIARPAKVSARFSTQVQLFIEQKEAPVASKTSLGIQSTSRVSQKSKD